MYALSPSKSIKGSNYGKFLKDKNVKRRMSDVQTHAQRQTAFDENRNIIGGWGWVMVFSGHFQQYFSYILKVSFYCWRKHPSIV
jgi:hypothetical protein